MIKGKDLIGRSVVALDSGNRIEKVHDLIFDHDANQVLALLVDEGGWFRAAKVVPFEAVQSIGEDAVMITSEDQVISAQDDSRIADLLETKVGIIGTRLLTTEGDELGKIADVYFEQITGKVVGYEATGGLFADLSNGRTFVPAPESISIGNDSAVVPASVAAAMRESEAGGIQGALGRASDSIKSSYENLSMATIERQKEYAIGKTAGGDVTYSHDLPIGADSQTEAPTTVIVHKGETITAAHADTAEAHGALNSLMAAATGGSMQAAYTSAAGSVQERVEDFSNASNERQMEYVVGKTAGNDVLYTHDLPAGAGGQPETTLIVGKGAVITGEQAHTAQRYGVLGKLMAAATSGSVQNAYSSASDTVQERVQERVEDVSNASRERQIEYVLGKVAGSDVHASDDTVIVLKGQTITPMAVQSAETKNVLGKLVASATAGHLQSRVQVRGSAANRSDIGGAGSSTIITADTPAAVSAPASVLGRRVRSDVYGQNRALIAAQGQIVTQGVLERARAQNREAELLKATGNAPVVVGSQHGEEAPIGDQISAGFSNVSAGASSLFERAKHWLGEKREDVGEVVEQRQDDSEAKHIRDALGRPVTRVILSPHDDIILNIGEIITNKAVAAAREVGILDMLLDSVSKDEVHINPLDVRPHETGSAALEGVSNDELHKHDTQKL